MPHSFGIRFIFSEKPRKDNIPRTCSETDNYNNEAFMTDNSAIPGALPGTVSNFEELRSSGRIYVDKTDYIFEIAVFNGPFILTRPANFGKTLLLSTLASLFSHGTRYFEGLKIAGHWKDSGEYNVVTIDFGGSFETVKSLDSHVCTAVEKAAHQSDTDLYARKGDSLHIPMTHRGPELIGTFLENSKNKTVLLIDNYDTPLSLPGLSEEQIKAFSHYLTEFFTVVNSCIGNLRFLLVTGVMPVPLSEMFAVFNGYISLTLDSENAALLGFTPEDVSGFMGRELARAAQVTGCEEKQLLRSLCRYYGGYRMTIDSPVEVINPRSLIRFLTHPEAGFRNYWPESGGRYASLAVNWLRSIPEDVLGNIMEVLSGPYSLKENYGYIGTPPGSALYHTGYLSVRTIKNELGRRRVILTPPNLNTIVTLLAIYFTLVSETPVSESDIGDIASGVREGLTGGYPEALVAALNRGLALLSFDKRDSFENGKNLRDIIFAILLLSGLAAERPVTGSSGDADITAEYLKNWKICRTVIRTRLAGAGEDAGALLAETEAGLRNAAPEDGTTAENTVKMAMVVSAAERKITLWKKL